MPRSKSKKPDLVIPKSFRMTKKEKEMVYKIKMMTHLYNNMCHGLMTMSEFNKLDPYFQRGLERRFALSHKHFKKGNPYFYKKMMERTAYLRKEFHNDD